MPVSSRVLSEQLVDQFEELGSQNFGVSRLTGSLSLSQEECDAWHAKGKELLLLDQPLPGGYETRLGELMINGARISADINRHHLRMDGIRERISELTRPYVDTLVRFTAVDPPHSMIRQYRNPNGRFETIEGRLCPYEPYATQEEFGLFLERAVPRRRGVDIHTFYAPIVTEYGSHLTDVTFLTEL